MSDARRPSGVECCTVRPLSKMGPVKRLIYFTDIVALARVNVACQIWRIMIPDPGKLGVISCILTFDATNVPFRRTIRFV